VNNPDTNGAAKLLNTTRQYNYNGHVLDHCLQWNKLATFVYSTVDSKAVTRGVFWVFEHPRNFREKLDTQKQICH